MIDRSFFKILLVCVFSLAFVNASYAIKKNKTICHNQIYKLNQSYKNLFHQKINLKLSKILLEWSTPYKEEKLSKQHVLTFKKVQKILNKEKLSLNQFKKDFINLRALYKKAGCGKYKKLQLKIISQPFYNSKWRSSLGNLNIYPYEDGMTGPIYNKKAMGKLFAYVVSDNPYKLIGVWHLDKNAGAGFFIFKISSDYSFSGFYSNLTDTKINQGRWNGIKSK